MKMKMECEEYILRSRREEKDENNFFKIYVYKKPSLIFIFCPKETTKPLIP